MHYFKFNNYTISFNESFNTKLTIPNFLFGNRQILFLNNKNISQNLVKMPINYNYHTNWNCLLKNNILTLTEQVTKDTFDLYLSNYNLKTSINQKIRDEITLKILFYHFFINKKHQCFIQTNTKQLNFIITHDIQKSFFNILKILILQFIGQGNSIFNIFNQTDLDSIFLDQKTIYTNNRNNTLNNKNIIKLINAVDSCDLRFFKKNNGNNIMPNKLNLPYPENALFGEIIRISKLFIQIL